jgi:hypothetical protein
MEGVMNRSSPIVAVAFVVTLALAVVAESAAAADRPSADGTKADYRYWPQGGGAVQQDQSVRGSSTPTSNDYHANYHANYSADPRDAAGARPPEPPTSRRDLPTFSDSDTHQRAPYGWRR